MSGSLTFFKRKSCIHTGICCSADFRGLSADFFGVFADFPWHSADILSCFADSVKQNGAAGRIYGAFGHFLGVPGWLLLLFCLHLCRFTDFRGLSADFFGVFADFPWHSADILSCFADSVKQNGAAGRIYGAFGHFLGVPGWLLLLFCLHLCRFTDFRGLSADFFGVFADFPWHSADILSCFADSVKQNRAQGQGESKSRFEAFKIPTYFQDTLLIPHPAISAFPFPQIPFSFTNAFFRSSTSMSTNPSW